MKGNGLCVWFGMCAPKLSYDIALISLGSLPWFLFGRSVVLFTSAMTEEIKCKELFTCSSKMYKDQEQTIKSKAKPWPLLLLCCFYLTVAKSAWEQQNDAVWLSINISLVQGRWSYSTHTKFSVKINNSLYVMPEGQNFDWLDRKSVV